MSCRGNRINPPTCNCPVGFADDGVSQNCTVLSCFYRCSTCSGPDLDDCSACRGANRKNLSEGCVCIDHYYDNSEHVSCYECNAKCASCHEGASVCTKCTGANRSTQVPNCECNDGFYDTGVANCSAC